MGGQESNTVQQSKKKDHRGNPRKDTSGVKTPLEKSHWRFQRLSPRSILMVIV